MKRERQHRVARYFPPCQQQVPCCIKKFSCKPHAFMEAKQPICYAVAAMPAAELSAMSLSCWQPVDVVAMLTELHRVSHPTTIPPKLFLFFFIVYSSAQRGEGRRVRGEVEGEYR